MYHVEPREYTNTHEHTRTQTRAPNEHSVGVRAYGHDETAGTYYLHGRVCLRVNLVCRLSVSPPSAENT